MEQFCADLSISAALLTESSKNSDISSSVDQFNQGLSSLIDQHAPLRTRTVILRPKAPWYNDSIRKGKTERRRLERCWRKSHLSIDRELYVNKCKEINDMVASAKMDYYSNLIQENKSNPKMLYSVVDKLLHRKADQPRPTWNDTSALASAFSDFFRGKITNIKEDLKLLQCDSSNASLLLEESAVTSQFGTFATVTTELVKEIISSSSVKSCELDPLPAPILKASLDVLLPTITKLINMSLHQGVVPKSMKEAIIRPLLKKSNLNQELLSNYRPISNLSFISKTIERVVFSQLNSYLHENDLIVKMQSAYKSGHSTESALIRVQNDILCSIDQGKCVILLLLDLSAAFDTVTHDILLQRLSTRFGVTGTVLNWFKSYLSERSQSVSVENQRSPSASLDCGVPQGSVLGPILYTLYTSPIADIMDQHKMNFHMYADDTQLYCSFETSLVNDLAAATRKLQSCVRDIHNWMVYNNLKLNDDKSEILVFHAKHRPTPSLDAVQIVNTHLNPADYAVNLGVVLDCTFSYNQHITGVCKSAFHGIRSIARIRRYLDLNTTKTLINAFVISKVDYCNSLLYGLPKQQLDRLQYVLNSAARLITLSRKSASITPLLKDLHWLPIELRIEFKILLQVYKIINHLGAPEYLCELLNIYVPRRTLRSGTKLFLERKDYNLKTYGLRAFSTCAPKLWNELPLSVRASKTIDIFKKNLKTHLFKKHFA